MTDNTTSSDLIKNVETARSTIDGLIESLGWIELNYRCGEAMQLGMKFVTLLPGDHLQWV
ncbi:ASN_collapsed_G0044200.mRNA.1.CDS.1 [Saccharomyces cerevisiae]|nr:ASN_collapsed_G0044200.mRNA.1.CDS.1 [Saccharomyces cerevisiae]